MSHLNEEQLVDLYYERPASSYPHLTECRKCREAITDLEQTLNAFADLPVPEPPPFTWREPFTARLASRWRMFALVPALAAALFAAFYMGRSTTTPPPKLAATPLAESGRERILVVALGNHLQRSEMVLLEVANGDRSTSPAVQERARNLIGETRLYRQTAVYSGDRNYSELLEELDRLLTAIANGQSQSSQPGTEQLEQLLFKIRVTGSNIEKGTEKL